MAEEDILFGKNRHFFGGIEPSNMESFVVVRSTWENRSATTDGTKIYAYLPKDTVVNGQTLCTVAGAVIVRREDRYPTDEFDGTVILDVTKSGSYTDTSAELDTSKTYYYAAFPYTTQGVYNRNPKNRFKYEPSSECWVYGYSMAVDNYDPSGRISYISGTDNYGEDFISISLNSSDNTLDFGSWTMQPGEKFMPRPCFLTDDGQVVCYLDPNDFTKNASGGVTSAGPDCAYHTMIEWPKIYVKRTMYEYVYTFKCSNKKIGPDWECWSNYDSNNNEIDHFYMSAYNASHYNSFTLDSKSGCSIFTKYGSPGEKTIDYLSRFDSGKNIWSIGVLADHLLIQDLLVMMAKTTDLQKVYGEGASFGSSMSAYANTSGKMDTEGMFYPGTSSTGVKVFGIEHYWGGYPRPIAGWIMDKGIQKIKMTRGTYDGTSVSDYNMSGDGYIPVTDYAPLGSSGGYISGMKFTPYGRFPIIVKGSASTYESDSMIFNASSETPGYATIGSRYSTSSGSGPFCVNFTMPLTTPTTTSSEHITAVTLSCKPLAE